MQVTNLMSGLFVTSILVPSKKLEDSVAKFAAVETPFLNSNDLARTADQLHANEETLHKRLIELRISLDQEQARIRKAKLIVVFAAAIILALTFFVVISATYFQRFDIVTTLIVSVFVLVGVFLSLKIHRDINRQHFLYEAMDKRTELMKEKIELRFYSR